MICNKEGYVNDIISQLSTKVNIVNYRNTQNLNANDLTGGCIYIIRPSYVSNMPAEISDATSYTLLIGFGQSDEAVQFMFNAAKNKMYYRQRYGSWGSWTGITFS